MTCFQKFYGTFSSVVLNTNTSNSLGLSGTTKTLVISSRDALAARSANAC